MTRYLYEREATERREALAEAFKIMRSKYNLNAKQRVSCCGNCSSYEMAQAEEDRFAKRGKRYNGSVHTNRQSTRPDEDYDWLHISYQASPDSLNPTLSTTSVGIMVAMACMEAGFTVDWNGDRARCVGVYLPSIHEVRERKEKLEKVGVLAELLEEETDNMAELEAQLTEAYESKNYNAIAQNAKMLEGARQSLTRMANDIRVLTTELGIPNPYLSGYEPMLGGDNA